MKKIFLFITTILFSANTFAQSPIHNFEELMITFKTGKSVKAVIYYAKCKLISDGVEEPESPDAIGGMRLDTYEYFDSTVFKSRVPSFVTSSQTVLIFQKSYGYVYNYVKLKSKKITLLR